MMTYKPMKNRALNSYHLIHTIELIPLSSYCAGISFSFIQRTPWKLYRV